VGILARWPRIRDDQHHEQECAITAPSSMIAIRLELRFAMRVLWGGLNLTDQTESHPCLPDREDQKPPSGEHAASALF
jgi:hypothetical protein